MAKGKKTGGRVKGSIAIDRRTVRALLDAMKCDPHEGMAKIALGDVICNVCLGSLESPVDLPDGQHAFDCAISRGTDERCTCDGITLKKCQSCKGTGREIVSPELRGKMYAELAQYVEAKKKHVEQANDPDNPIVQGYIFKEWKPEDKK